MTTRSLQELFVDRLTQLDRFRRSLEGASGRRIILISAGPGMGKSWMLRRFNFEAAQGGIPAALIDFSDGQAYDVLALVRRFRDLLGPEPFNRLTAAINEATAPRLILGDGGPPSSASLDLSGAQAGDVRIGDVAGGNIIRDNLFIVQTENPVLLQAIEDRVTQIFFDCLADLEARGPALFLFDSYERTSQEHDRWVPNAADRWIRRELLARIRDGKLKNSVAVLAGSQLPEFDAEWGGVVGRMELGYFTVEDVAQYLRENRGLAELTDVEIQTLYTAIQGNPQLLGIIGDNLEQAARPAADDDW
jgi:hypothetical protein